MWYLLIASLVWAPSFGFIKHALAGLDPNFVACVRLSISLAVFLPFLRRGKADARTAMRLALIGAVQYGIMYMAYIASYRFLDAHEVALFTILTPIYVTLLHDLETRRLHVRNLGAAVLAVAGAGIIVMSGGNVGGTIRGFLIVQVANICFAFGQTAYRRLMRREQAPRDEQVFAMLYAGAALVTLVPAAVTTEWSQLSLSPGQWLVLGYLGVIPSGIGFFLWNVGARRSRPGVLAVFNNAKIPLAVAVSILVFGERGPVAALASGTLVLVAAAWLAGRPTRPAPAG